MTMMMMMRPTPQHHPYLYCSLTQVPRQDGTKAHLPKHERKRAKKARKALEAEKTAAARKAEMQKARKALEAEEAAQAEEERCRAEEKQKARKALAAEEASQAEEERRRSEEEPTPEAPRPCSCLLTPTPRPTPSHLRLHACHFQVQPFLPQPGSTSTSRPSG